MHAKRDVNVTEFGKSCTDPYPDAIILVADFRLLTRLVVDYLISENLDVRPLWTLFKLMVFPMPSETCLRIVSN